MIVFNYVFIFLFIGVQLISANVLSLEQYIRGALATHPNAHLDHLTYIQELQRLDANTSIKEWTLFAQAFYQKGLGFPGITSFSDSGKIYQTTTGLSKILTHTGTRLTISASRLARQNQAPFPGAGSIPNYHESHIRLHLVQPLLKNMWGQLDRYPLQLQGLQVQLAKLKYESDVNAYIRDRVDDYLTWMYHHQDLALRHAQYHKATDQVTLLERQVKRGASDLINLVLAKQNAVSKKIAADDAEFAYLTIQNRIASFYVGGVTTNIALSPDLETQLYTPDTSEYKLWPYMQTQSVLAKSFELQQEVQLLTVSTKKNQYLPDLDLAVSHTRKNLAVSSQTLSQALEGGFGNRETQISLQLTYPIGNRHRKSDYHVVLTEQKKVRRQQDKEWITVHTLIRDIEDHIKRTQTQLKDTIELLRLSQKLARLEHEKYNQGRSHSLTFVLNAEDRVLATKRQQLQYTLTQNRLYNQQHALLNTYSRYYN